MIMYELRQQWIDNNLTYLDAELSRASRATRAVPRRGPRLHDLHLARVSITSSKRAVSACAPTTSSVESKVEHEVNKPRRDEPAACTVANISLTTG
eukprot:scaffold9728_cov132-Isochrysis_galbana.AAC.2